jgi:hypothetical protein
MVRLSGLPVAVAVFAVYLAAAPWEFPTEADGAAMLATAESLLDHQTLAIDRRFTTDHRNAPSAKRGVDGNAYAKYGIGLPLIEVPLLGIADLLDRFRGQSQRHTRTIVLSLLNPLLTALVVLIVHATCERLGATVRAARFIALGYGLATPALSYATYDNSEALQSLVVALATFTFIGFAQDQRDRSFWVCGAVLGAGVLTKVTLVALVPVFVLAGWVVCWSKGANRMSTLGHVASMMVPVTVAIGIAGWLNWVHFGSATATGYNTPVLTNPLGKGLYALLLGPNKGLVVFAPLVLLVPLGIAELWRRSLAVSIVVLVGIVIWTMLNATFYDFGGGWVWGPRYLQPILPMAFIAVSSAIGRPRMKGIAAVLFTAGLIVNLIGVAIDEGAYRRTLVTVWLPDETGYALAGNTTTGEIGSVPRRPEDVMPVFSSIAGHWWLGRVALARCDCSRVSLRCACRSGDFWDNRVFVSPPWRSQFPQAHPSPPYGASIIWPRLLRGLYRMVVFDPDHG